MGWTDWLKQRRPPDGPRPSVRDVTFDGGPLIAKKSADDSLQWVDPDGDSVTARVDRTDLPPWTLQDIRGHSRARAALRGGGIISTGSTSSSGVSL